MAGVPLTPVVTHFWESTYGRRAQHVAQLKHKDKSSYMDHVEDLNPSHLAWYVSLWENILGNSATFKNSKTDDQEIFRKSTQTLEMVQNAG